MAQVVVEDIDPVVIEKLTARAGRHSRSLADEIKEILWQAANTEPKTPMAAFKERAERFGAAMAARVHSDSAALVREDRDSE